jgi:hypothetical protein
MIHERILYIISASPKALCIAEILPLLELVNLHKQYSNKYSMKINIYQTLNYLVRKGFISKVKDFETKHHPFRFVMTDSGLDYLSRDTNLEVVKRILERMN